MKTSDLSVDGERFTPFGMQNVEGSVDGGQGTRLRACPGRILAKNVARNSTASDTGSLLGAGAASRYLATEAGGLIHSRLGDDKVAFYCIEGCAYADGQGGLERDVTEGQARHDGDF
jgi:hypothetical protein